MQGHDVMWLHDVGGLNEKLRLKQIVRTTIYYYWTLESTPIRIYTFFDSKSRCVVFKWFLSIKTEVQVTLRLIDL